jgi:hypothetical protein
MGSVNPDLPYIDEHSVRIDASRDQVWNALNRYVGSSLASGKRGPLTKVLGTEPASGFEISETVPEESLTLAGRHRFSRYSLVFELADADNGATLLRARSYAAFPGIPGRTYRALVIGTRLHVVATNHLLGSIRRLSLRGS